MMGKYDVALKSISKVRILVGKSPYGLFVLGHIYVIMGNKTDAMKVLYEMMQFSKQGYSLSGDIAFIFSGLGNTDNTFIWLEKAFQDRHRSLSRINGEPHGDNLRSDSRFKSLIKAIEFKQ